MKLSLESNRTKIKSVCKWRYEVMLSKDIHDIYHVHSENMITNKVTYASFVDYNMACYAFDAKINLFEGN